MSYGTPPPPPPYGSPAPGQPGQPAGNNKKAIWALVLGILGCICCGIFTGIPAIILGKMAQNEIDASGGAQGGRGMATAGFILGIVAIVLFVIGLILNLSGALDFSGTTTTY
ncbi:DUF4190 domain-containing protein [Nocardioides sp. NPDC087217]|uniref:DUF4190 domain-containing protein n=1 Tax=Nocardioides sp. NPDC087217 TaxID=3364335 RepID=UPI0038111484